MTHKAIPNPTPEPKASGRPIVGATPMVRQIVTMEPSDIEIAKRLGHGVIAAGVRIALRQADAK